MDRIMSLKTSNKSYTSINLSLNRFTLLGSNLAWNITSQVMIALGSYITWCLLSWTDITRNKRKLFRPNPVIVILSLVIVVRMINNHSVM